MTQPARRARLARLAWLDFPWTLAVVALSAATTASALWLAGWPRSLADLLVADLARIRAGEIWRVVTGPLVHATAGHLARDLALCAIVGIGYELPLARAWPWLCGLGLAVPTLAVCAVNPGYAAYCGTSGLSHALIAAAVVYELARGPAVAWRRWLVWAAALGTAGKLGYEAAFAAPLFPMPLGSGVEQAPIAHLAGAAVGALVAGLSLAVPPVTRPPNALRMHRASPRA